MRLTACPCGAEYLDRIPRSWWMRVFASRRLYRCSLCGSRMFIPRVLAIRPMETVPALPTPPASRAARAASTE